MEHEITGHTRKVYKIWKNPEVPFWKKFKEIGVEILIIVFAVSLAAFLERQREHSSEQKQVKEFLLGIKTDMQNDITEMENDKISFQKSHIIFNYIINHTPGEVLSRDTINAYSKYLLNTTGLLANDGRYQGFKSSGKLSSIENIALQNDILDLYQENIPSLQISSTAYTARKEVFFRYLYDNLKRNPDGSTNMPVVLTTDKALNVCSTLASTDEILERYEIVINKSKKIIAAIDQEYK